MGDGRPTGHAWVESGLSDMTSASRTPGIQYLVVTSEGVRFEHASGWADIHHRVPMAAATTMMAYSMSKTITAVAVLQLVERGKVGFDDPAEHYVSNFPYGPQVTIRQLLSHTSGIPNPIPLRWVHPAARHATFDEQAALAAVLHAHPGLAYPPGTKYRYSNIGYWLLGRVVERASGERFTAYVADHVLRPLGVVPGELGYTVVDSGRQATGYLEKYSFLNLLKGFLVDRELIGDYCGRWLEIRSHYLNGPAFGGLVGSARGFGRFLHDQLAERSVLLGEATRRFLHEPQRTSRGAPVAMTLGWHIGDLGGTRFLFKEGGGGGFHCMMRLYPVDGVGTVVMTNATGFDVRRLLDSVDQSFLGRR